MNYATQWENLTIQNNFLFTKVMKNERICKKMIEKILHIEIDRLVYLEEEKTIDIRLDSRSIRLDVYVKDGQGTIFNVEMQTSNPHHALAKRSRYYQGLIDMDCLEKGVYYDQLNQTYIIFICTFDLFGMGRHIYTFQNICQEDMDLTLGDGTTKLFLNSKGTADDVAPDVQAFLQYVEGVLTENPFVQEIDAEVAHVKRNKEWRREFMTLQDELDMQRRLGQEEGKNKMATAIALNMIRHNMSLEEIAKLTGSSIEEVQALVTQKE
jgi:predicted transposase/invertase (TIGR01784 family)